MSASEELDKRTQRTGGRIVISNPDRACWERVVLSAEEGIQEDVGMRPYCERFPQTRLKRAGWGLAMKECDGAFVEDVNSG